MYCSTNFRPEDLDVKIDGDQLIVTASQDVAGAGQSRSRVFEQKFSLPSGVRPEDIQSSLTREGTLVITANRVDKQPSNNKSSVEDVQNEFDKTMNPQSWEQNQVTPSKQNHRSERNPFHFNTGLLSPVSSASGLSKIEHDDKTYKIHVDVKNFSPEDLVIKTVDDCVIVEANHEEKTNDGRTYSNKSFSQSFNLPWGTDPESVTSALSKDGVLTISAPITNANSNNSLKYSELELDCDTR